jgi:hypothetical protein
VVPFAKKEGILAGMKGMEGVEKRVEKKRPITITNHDREGMPIFLVIRDRDRLFLTLPLEARRR